MCGDVTVWLAADTATVDIQDVIDGTVGVYEFVGLTDSGKQVTVRFLLAPEGETAGRDQ